jgi:hypothetical protein
MKKASTIASASIKIFLTFKQREPGPEIWSILNSICAKHTVDPPTSHRDEVEINLRDRVKMDGFD